MLKIVWWLSGAAEEDIVSVSFTVSEVSMTSEVSTDMESSNCVIIGVVSSADKGSETKQHRVLISSKRTSVRSSSGMFVARLVEAPAKGVGGVYDPYFNNKCRKWDVKAAPANGVDLRLEYKGLDETT